MMFTTLSQLQPKTSKSMTLQNNKFYYNILIISITVSMLLVTPTMASDVKLVTGDGFEPFTSKDMDNGGMITEVVRSSYRNAGHSVKIDFMPWKRGLRMLQEGEVTGTFPYVKTEKRKRKYYFSNPIVTSKKVVITQKGKENEIQSYEDLEGKDSCRIDGYSQPNKKIAKMRKTGELENAATVQSLANCLKMLRAGRIDVAFSAKRNAVYVAKKELNAVNEIGISDFVVKTVDYHLIVSKEKGSKSDIQMFNQALSDLRDSGKLKSIKKKYE